jgi:hypothetical protein
VSVDPEWLKTPEGRAWLETDEGVAWWRTDEGQEWSHSEDAHRWYEELEQAGWQDYVSGRAPGPPEWGITPDEAPRPGARIRLTSTDTTLGGTTLKEGELAIVTELHFMPVGSVRLHVRTLDGRKRIIMSRGEYEAAS